MATEYRLSHTAKEIDEKLGQIESINSDLHNLDIIVSAIKKGLSNSVKEALLNCFSNVAWTTEDGQQCYDALHDALYNDSALVVDIDVDYSGDSVEIGVQTNTLPVVTVFYDDGTIEEITSGFTCTPEMIEEGDNIVTVFYKGFSKTFTVVGVKPKTYGIRLSDGFTQSEKTTTNLFGGDSFSLNFTSYVLVMKIILGDIVNSGSNIGIFANIETAALGYTKTDWWQGANFPQPSETFVYELENVSTITYENIPASFITEGDAIKIGHSSTGFNEDITFLGYEWYGVNDSGVRTILSSVKPTSTLGVLHDSFTNTDVVAWEDTSGMTLVEM